MAGLAPPAEPPHLDLLHVARRVHKERTRRSAGACRLVALERDILGFERVDDVASGDVSACYLHFLRTGDARALLGVVEHNAWDVVAMVALVGLYGEPLPGAEPARRRTTSRASRGRCAAPARSTARWQTADVGGRAQRRRRERTSRCARAPTSPRRAAIARARSPTSRRWPPRSTTPSVRLELAKLYEHWVGRARREAARLGRAGDGRDRRAASRRGRGASPARPTQRRAVRRPSERRGTLPSGGRATSAANDSWRIVSASSTSRLETTSGGATRRTLP